MVLEREDGTVAEAARHLGVVPADLHVHLGGPAKVEGAVRRPEDLVEVRGHAPAVTLTREQVERERGPAKDLAVEGFGPETLGELTRGHPGLCRDELPYPELAGDLEEVCHVVPTDEVQELRDLLDAGRLLLAHAAYGARGMRRPRPGRPTTVPRSKTASPRDRTTSGQPVTSHPSYGS